MNLNNGIQKMFIKGELWRIVWGLRRILVIYLPVFVCRVWKKKEIQRIINSWKVMNGWCCMCQMTLPFILFFSFALLLSINHNQSNVIEFRWKAGWNIEFQFGTYGTIMSLSMKPDNRCWNMIPCLTHTMCVLCGFYGHNFSMMIDFSLFQFNWSKVQTKWINHSWKPRAMNISNILKSIKLKFFMNILHF